MAGPTNLPNIKIPLVNKNLTINQPWLRFLIDFFTLSGAGIEGTGYVVQTPTTLTVRSLTATAGDMTITNPTGQAGNSLFTLDTTAVTAAAYGLHTATYDSKGRATAAVTRTITSGNGISITNGDGVSGNPTVAVASTNLIQCISTSISTTGSTSTQIPFDGTIPQSTEGVELMTVTITPKNINNILIIDVVVPLVESTLATNFIGALFQDSTADALAAGAITNAATTPQEFILRHRMTAGTTSATTFKFRYGPSTATTSFVLRRSATDTPLGVGTIPATIQVKEYLE